MAASIDNPYDLQEVERGVYKLRVSPEGYAEWVVISRAGKLLRKEMVALETIEDESEVVQIERQLRRYLELKDRRTHLKAV